MPLWEQVHILLFCEQHLWVHIWTWQLIFHCLLPRSFDFAEYTLFIDLSKDITLLDSIGFNIIFICNPSNTETIWWLLFYGIHYRGEHVCCYLRKTRKFITRNLIIKKWKRWIWLRCDNWYNRNHPWVILGCSSLSQSSSYRSLIDPDPCRISE